MLDVLIDKEDVKLLRIVRTRMTSHNQKSVQNCDRQYLLSRMVIDAAHIVCRAVYKTIEHLSLVGRRSGGFAAEPRAVRSRAGSVSVFKSRYRFFKISRYRFRFFPHEPTIAYRITQSLTPYALPFSPNGVWALEFALQIAAIRDSDIVTIDNL